MRSERRPRRDARPCAWPSGRHRQTVAVAVLPLEAAAARARLVAAPACILECVELRQVGRRPVLAEQRAHDPHRAVDMMEERLEARAEIVQARVTGGRLDEAVFRAAAVAGETDVAVEAVLGQRVSLGLTELNLLL